MDHESRIICGDAVEVLRTIPESTVTLTVTSPPYYGHKDYGVPGQIGRERSLDLYLGRIRSVLAELLRATDETGSCFFVVGDSYRNRKLLLVPHRIALLSTEVGWTVRNDIIWQKKDPPPESPRDRWRTSHEHVLFLTKRAKGYRFNGGAVRTPHAPATIRRWGNGQVYDGPKSRGRTREQDSRMRHGKSFPLNPNGCLPTDVWPLACANASARHYAVFPDGLVQRIVEACSAPGDLVLDPFVGSGTTCVVAAALGRRCLGIELNPTYAALATGALEQAVKSGHRTEASNEVQKIRRIRRARRR